MKTKLLEILFCILFLAFFIGMFSLAELLIQVINMNTVMTICYTVFGICLIYLFKN